MARTRSYVLAAAAALITLLPPAAAAAAHSGAPVQVAHVGQIDEQDIAPQPNSEPDTEVEPDVAVSPVDPRIAVAAAHDGRYPDGGAVDISYAWTHDGGKTWHHAALPGVTKAAGGSWDRASDPVLAFGPDGSVYLSVLDVSLNCPSGVTVSRSTDGGRTFGPPMVAHYSDSCNYSDDKNFLVVDNGRYSPHRGRLYQFWTPFLYDAAGNNTGAVQVVRWSDDQGRSWGPIVNLTQDGTFSQNSNGMVLPDGTLVDTYLDYGSSSGGEEPESRVGEQGDVRAAPLDAPPADKVSSKVSHDGGRTWSAPSTVTTQAGEGPVGIRCCLDSSTADQVTGQLYTTWISPDSTTVELSRSGDGVHWSPAAPVTRPVAGHDYINVDVSAWQGRVYVASSTRDTTVQDGRYVRQQLSASTGGAGFGPPVPLGPLSDLNYAAFAGGKFPGDYMGTAARDGYVYSVWCRSSTPPDPTAQYHQTVWSATLRG